MIALIILAFLKPLRKVFRNVIIAETARASVLGETIFGVKTVKSLAIEPQRKDLWDAKVADAGKWRMEFGKLANWPQTMVTPIERFMSIGIILLGAYLALKDESGYAVGCAVRVHDAVHARRPAAGRPRPADRGFRGIRRRHRRSRLGAEPAAGSRCRIRRPASEIRGRDHRGRPVASPMAAPRCRRWTASASRSRPAP